MKALVAIKRVLDYNIKVQVKADETDVDIGNAKMSMNPFDEIAIEEAVRQKEAGKLTEIVAVSIGVKACEETLRTALAMGADRAIHIETDLKIEPLAVAKLLVAIGREEQPDVYILGKQAIDDDANQTAQMLAALLGMPQATFSSQVILDDGYLTAHREIDGGVEIEKMKLPAVISADLHLNEPRYIKLPAMMMAKKKPIEKHTPESLGVSIENRIKVLKVTEPPERQAGIKVASVAELVVKLKEAKVI